MPSCGTDKDFGENIKNLSARSHYTGNHVRRDDVPSVSRSAERRLKKIGRQHGALPEVAFLHARIRSTHGQR